MSGLANIRAGAAALNAMKRANLLMVEWWLQKDIRHYIWSHTKGYRGLYTAEFIRQYTMPPLTSASPKKDVPNCTVTGGVFLRSVKEGARAILTIYLGMPITTGEHFVNLQSG